MVYVEVIEANTNHQIDKQSLKQYLLFLSIQMCCFLSVFTLVNVSLRLARFIFLLMLFFICNQAIKSSSLSENSRRAEELERLRACEGEYATHYDTLSLIGKGSFGFVWTARSKKNHQEVKYFFKILKRNYLGSKQKGQSAHIMSALCFQKLLFGSSGLCFVLNANVR